MPLPFHRPQWVNETVGSRLIGIDVGLFSRRRRNGHYGPSRRGRNGEILVSTRGLELASRTVITDEQIVAAIAGRPLPPAPYGSFEQLQLSSQRRPSIDEIGARVARTLHIEPME